MSDSDVVNNAVPEQAAGGNCCEILYRCEIIANNSVQDDIVDVLEAACPDILYSILPTVYGRGENDRKLGSTTWPETNFILIAYATENMLQSIKNAVQAVKERFSGEGIKLFIVQSNYPGSL